METGRAEDSASNLSASTASGGNKRRAYRTTCAHFYWVTREPGSFEWFKGVMNEVAEMDKKVTTLASLPFFFFPFVRAGFLMVLAPCRPGCH